MLVGDAKPLILSVTVDPEHAVPPPEAWIETLSWGDTVKLVVTVESHPLAAVNTSVYVPVDVYVLPFIV